MFSFYKTVGKMFRGFPKTMKDRKKKAEVACADSHQADITTMPFVSYLRERSADKNSAHQLLSPWFGVFVQSSSLHLNNRKINSFITYSTAVVAMTTPNKSSNLLSSHFIYALFPVSANHKRHQSFTAHTPYISREIKKHQQSPLSRTAHRATNHRRKVHSTKKKTVPKPTLPNDSPNGVKSKNTLSKKIWTRFGLCSEMHYDGGMRQDLTADRTLSDATPVGNHWTRMTKIENISGDVKTLVHISLDLTDRNYIGCQLVAALKQILSRELIQKDVFMFFRYFSDDEQFIDYLEKRYNHPSQMTVAVFEQLEKSEKSFNHKNIIRCLERWMWFRYVELSETELQVFKEPRLYVMQKIVQEIYEKRMHALKVDLSQKIGGSLVEDDINRLFRHFKNDECVLHSVGTEKDLVGNFCRIFYELMKLGRHRFNHDKIEDHFQKRNMNLYLECSPSKLYVRHVGQ